MRNREWKKGLFGHDCRVTLGGADLESLRPDRRIGEPKVSGEETVGAPRRSVGPLPPSRPLERRLPRGSTARLESLPTSICTTRPRSFGEGSPIERR